MSRKSYSDSDRDPTWRETFLGIVGNIVEGTAKIEIGSGMLRSSSNIPAIVIRYNNRQTS